jgi:DNA-directed RNA polymerase specialized sigma24 family protein
VSTGDGGSHADRLIAEYDALRRFAAVVGPVDVEPDDLVQEAFVRVLRRGLDGIEHLDRYLRLIVMNLVRNEKRGWRRRQLAFVRHGVPDPVIDSTFVDVSDLASLTADERAVLWLAEVEGWPYGQIAEVLQCSESAARMRGPRARRALQLQIAEERA